MTRRENLENVIFDLIKNEYEKFGFVFEQRIEKMASLLNIEPTKCRSCIQRLVWRGKIEKDGKRLYLA